MTEGEWLACTGDDTGDMQECLQGRGSERKLRLFACACCRRIEHLLTEEPSRRAVEVAERFADARATEPDLHDAWRQAEAAAYEMLFLPEEALSEVSYNAALAAHWAAVDRLSERDAVELASHAAFYAQQTAGPPEERRWQAKALCDILGDREPLPQVEPGWLTSDVVALARSIYDERAFDRLPILADALQDAGCENADVLDHCRGPGPHVRGCWVVDMLLGKH
jgi:hypothetical protein